jgi:hypothetical protein
MGRIDSADVFKDAKAHDPSGYVLRLSSDGSWRLLSCAYKKVPVSLAAGTRARVSTGWHHLRLVFQGQKITAVLDGQTLASVQNADHKAGMFGIGTGWNRAQFDNLSVTK